MGTIAPQTPTTGKTHIMASQHTYDHTNGDSNASMEETMEQERMNCNTCKYRGDYPGYTPCDDCQDCEEWKPEGDIKEGKMTSTEQHIITLFSNFSKFLIEKNKRYGDSALYPKQIFSNMPADSQICNRIDDKLGRIEQSSELKKNDVSDVFGYVALLMIQRGWIEFDDLLD